MFEIIDYFFNVNTVKFKHFVHVYSRKSFSTSTLKNFKMLNFRPIELLLGIELLQLCNFVMLFSVRQMLKVLSFKF